MLQTAPKKRTPDATDNQQGRRDDDFAKFELKDRVVIMLLFKQLVTMKQIERNWHKWRKLIEQRQTEALWRILAEDPELERERIFACAAEVYAFEDAVITPETARYIRKNEEVFSAKQWELLGTQFLVPINKTGTTWTFASFDPTHPEMGQTLRKIGLPNYELRYAPEVVIKDLIKDAFPQHVKNEFLERVAQEMHAFDLGTEYEKQAGLIDEDALEAEIGRSTLINLFEAALLEAVRRGASDIHIFPNKSRQIEIHFRIDGQLDSWHVEKRVHAEAFLAVVKDNSVNVDRFERDAAQDGFIQRTIDGSLIRFRVSVLPIANASHEIRSESIVIRVLDDRKVVTDLKKLGLLEEAMERFNWAIQQPHGMIILTGPTGSGKTTTLFACLHQVVNPRVNVLTVEDPVEYLIEGVRQIKLNPKLDLEQAIRAILRHDPDIVMVGEMRDRATADLAIKLANTGHLTFSTLHTNDAPSAISRLYKMGVETFLIAYAINLIVAQRLIRTLCPSCKEVDTARQDALLLKLGFTEKEMAGTTLYRAGENRKCKTCNGIGYKGRRAITETLAFSDEIRAIIVESEQNIDEEAIRKQAVKEGMLSLRDAARRIVTYGETSIHEMIRVVSTDM
ncbi:MAG: GspE/PulE family protein [Rhodothermales bacterium]|nr:GspE/PulE family protein [Rhodothermales bacterium]